VYIVTLDRTLIKVNFYALWLWLYTILRRTLFHVFFFFLNVGVMDFDTFPHPNPLWPINTLCVFQE